MTISYQTRDDWTLLCFYDRFAYIQRKVLFAVGSFQLWHEPVCFQVRTCSVRSPESLQLVKGSWLICHLPRAPPPPRGLSSLRHSASSPRNNLWWRRSSFTQRHCAQTSSSSLNKLAWPPSWLLPLSIVSVYSVTVLSIFKAWKYYINIIFIILYIYFLFVGIMLLLCLYNKKVLIWLSKLLIRIRLIGI